MSINCCIKIQGNKAKITGTFPETLLMELTSYFVEGYKYSPNFKYGRWDGRKHLRNKKDNTFPAGLVPSIINAFKAHDRQTIIEIVDQRELNPPVIGNKGFDLEGIEFGKGKYDYQLKAAEIFVKRKRGIIKASVGSGKTEISAAITKHLTVPTIFLCPGIELLYQTRDRFSKRLGIPKEDIGMIGDGEFSISPWITIATVQSLYSYIENKDATVMLACNRWKLLIVDECHGSGASTWFDVINHIPAYYKLGLSATPLDRSDGGNLCLIAQTDEIIYEIGMKELIEKEVLVKPYIEIIKITEPKLTGKKTWQEVHTKCIIENPYQNEAVVRKTHEYIDQGKQVLVLVEAIKHGKMLEEDINLNEFKCKFINGQESSETRKETIDSFNKGDLRCIVATSILKQGFDTPNIDVLIAADAGKSKITTIQRAGRGLRKKPGKDKLIIVEFMNTCHKFTTKHSLQRLDTYRAEDCFDIKIIE